MKTLWLLLCLALIPAARAEVVEIPLSGLHGDYDPGCAEPNEAPASRTLVFTVPEGVASINLMRMKFSGMGSPGYYIVERQISEGFAVYDTLAYPADIRLLLTAPSLGESWFFGIAGVPEPGIVDGLATLTSGPSPSLDPNLLLGATITAEMYMAFDPCEAAWIDPLTSISAVHLVLDAVTVAAEIQLWGDVKALYR